LLAAAAIAAPWRHAAGVSIRPLPRSVGGPVLEEPSAQDHYGWLRNYTEVPHAEFQSDTGPPILRVKDLDDATFQQLIRDGTPFVVDDCTRGFDAGAVSNFECKDFADRWPTGNMRAEYTPGQYHIYLKDPGWYSTIAPQRSHVEHMAKKNKIAGPYIWHVKDEEPLKTKRQVQKHWRTPYFLEHSLANRMEANESFEFWFSMAGGGTFTHADAYCESTISMQFRGTKRWRVQAFPRAKHFLNATSFGDEQIYDHKQHVPWTPESEFTVGPGQCFIFPTGYLHETYIDPADNDHGCYTASTFQFNHPRQVNLYRSYMSSFSMSHYGMGEPCLTGMTSYATLFSKVDAKGTPDAAAVRSQAEKLIAQIEGSSGDGKITRDELYAHFCVDKQSRKRVMKAGQFYYTWHKLLSAEQKAQMEEEAMNIWSEDALQYHDIDRDRAISLDELAQSLLQWYVVRWRSEHIKQAGGKKAKASKWLDTVLASEVDVLRKYYCEDPTACPAADELSAYGKQLKKEGKKAVGTAMRKVSSMFEHHDGDSETLTMVDRATGSSGQKTVKAIQNEL